MPGGSDAVAYAFLHHAFQSSAAAFAQMKAHFHPVVPSPACLLYARNVSLKSIHPEWVL